MRRRPDAGTDGIEVLMYLIRCSPYGEARAVRQALSIEAIQLVVGVDSEFVPAERARVLGFTSPALRRIDARASSILGRHTVLTRAERRVRHARLRRLLGTARTAYTMFGGNAIELADVLGRSRNTGTRLVFHAAGSDITTARSRGAAYRRALLRAADRSDLVLCGSEYIRTAAHDLGFDPSRTRVHYLGTTIPNASAEEIVRAPEPAFLAVSRLHPVKGLDVTLRAFASVRRMLPGARLTVLGDGAMRAPLVDQAHELGVLDAVDFAGLVDQAAVQRHMRSSWVFVQHNVRTPAGAEEALGGSIIEAQAHRMPVVGTWSGGVPEAVIHGETGILVRPGDAEAMAAAMVDLACDERRRVAMGDAGHAHVSTTFDGARQDARLEEVLLHPDAAARPSSAT